MGCCLAKQENDDASESTEWHDATPAKGFKRHLIVDDSIENRQVLSRYLTRCNLKTVLVKDGLRAVEAVTDSMEYDCIWMDLNMPIMSGIEATKRIRKLGYTGLILALTGHVDYESKKICKEVGFNYVMAKPILREELYGTLRRFTLI